MRGAWVVAVGLIGCGRLHFADLATGDGGGTDGDDGSGDGGTRVCGDWQPPEHVPALSSNGQDFSPSSSTDGLRLYMHSDRLGNFDLFVATRTTIAQAFATPTYITELADGLGQDGGPSTTDDERTIAFDSERNGGFSCIIVSDRPDRDAIWGATNEHSALCTVERTFGPEISGDGLRLYYTLVVAPATTHGNIMYSVRANRGVEFTVATPVTGITPADVGYPSLSSDELEIYYEATNPLRLVTATRPTSNAPFENNRELTELNMDSTVDPGISSDGTELWFASDRQPSLGGFDLWRSTRRCN